jgi:hypothetical protein
LINKNYFAKPIDLLLAEKEKEKENILEEKRHYHRKICGNNSMKMSLR